MSIQAECRQIYCAKIRQMLTFLINFYWPKAFYGPDNLIHVTECISKNYLWTQHFYWDTREDKFGLCELCFCNILFDKNKFGSGAVFSSVLVSELQKPPLHDLNPIRLWDLFPFSRNKRTSFD
jgi:hypothetical protein